jgi:hypothetical protein
MTSPVPPRAGLSWRRRSGSRGPRTLIGAPVPDVASHRSRRPARRRLSGRMSRLWRMIGTTTVLISPVYSPTRGIAEEPGLPEMADNCKTGARESSSITGTRTLARPVKAYRAIARSPRDPLVKSYLLSHDDGKEFPSSSIHRQDTSRQPRCARRSEDTDARREARRCFGRSDRRAHGDRPKLRSIRTKARRARGQPRQHRGDRLPEIVEGPLIEAWRDQRSEDLEVITPSPEGDGFFSGDACLSPATLPPAGPIRPCQPTGWVCFGASHDGPWLEVTPWLPSGWIPTRPTEASDMFSVY